MKHTETTELSKKPYKSKLVSPVRRNSTRVSLEVFCDNGNKKKISLYNHKK